ncbi:M20/M25/M40 family metallo-hydrolase [Sphingomonas sp. RT2P30]|uniref:M20/M25/M40 family metallo-hydrolase n=1 Tax=Parasphingomonas halimpatiens TaxID=3096162 RepID=UPI003FA6E02A
MMRKTTWLAGIAALVLPLAAQAQSSPLTHDETEFRDLYRALVETDTSATTGSCTALADKIEQHLRANGYRDPDITRFAVPERPKEGGLVVILRGTSETLKPLLLLGHLDVVAAKRADWTRDPYVMVEENGYFYGRGTADMKAMDAIWIDAMARFRLHGFHPKRTIKLALTCGEEGGSPFNGAEWLAKNRPELIAAGFALNEGGGGRTDGHGKLLTANIHVGEKASQHYRIATTNPGGHSSAPVRDNAIYQLADALVKVRTLEFPIRFNPTTRAYFARAGAARGDELGAAMVALAKNPGDAAAEAVVNRDKSFHSMLRTTCVATLIDGGHAPNALPQRAGANINCRIIPGETVESTRAALVTAIGDPGVTVTAEGERGPLAVPPPLDPKVIGPAEKLVAKYYPGVPLIPTMSTGATDGIFLEAIGIPSYGPPGLFGDPDGNGTHGLNEREAVKAVFTGRALLTELVKVYADAE